MGDRDRKLLGKSWILSYMNPSHPLSASGCPAKFRHRNGWENKLQSWRVIVFPSNFQCIPEDVTKIHQQLSCVHRTKNLYKVENDSHGALLYPNELETVKKICPFHCISNNVCQILQAKWINKSEIMSNEIEPFWYWYKKHHFQELPQTMT